MVYCRKKEGSPMKRIIALFLVCLLILSGCASGPKPALSEMLGTHAGSIYHSAFGFSFDTVEMQVFSEENLAAFNGADEFTPEALMALTDSGNAVTVFAAAPTSGASASLSLFPAAGLPGDIETAADYAAYGMSVMPDKLSTAGYTDVQIQQISVKLDDGEHPAILCSAMITEGVPYHLLQICFQEGDWMGTLSLSSLESEEALGALLTRIRITD